MPVKTILLVEALDSQRIVMKWLLANYGYIVDTVSTAEESLVVFDPAIHDMVVTDLLLGGMSGTELAHVVKLRSPKTPVVLFSEDTPADSSCFDAILHKSENLAIEDHLLSLKDILDRLLLPQAVEASTPSASPQSFKTT